MEFDNSVPGSDTPFPFFSLGARGKQGVAGEEVVFTVDSGRSYEHVIQKARSLRGSVQRPPPS